MSRKLIKANGHESALVTVEVPQTSNDGGSTLIPAQGLKIMEALSGPIDEWALDTRPGRGGKTFTYISHGYVTDQLNKTFGIFWDWTLQRMGNDKYYDIIEYEVDSWNERLHIMEKKPVKEVMVIGLLKVHIFNERGTKLTTVERTGEGGKVWENNTNASDAVQSASSDGLKRAAFRLGNKFGLQLYYDDEERQQEHLEKLNPAPPQTLTQLIVRLAKENISDEEWLQYTETPIERVEERDLGALWQKLVEGRNEAQNNPT